MSLSTEICDNKFDLSRNFGAWSGLILKRCCGRKLLMPAFEPGYRDRAGLYTLKSDSFFAGVSI